MTKLSSMDKPRRGAKLKIRRFRRRVSSMHLHAFVCDIENGKNRVGEEDIENSKPQWGQAECGEMKSK